MSEGEPSDELPPDKILISTGNCDMPEMTVGLRCGAAVYWIGETEVDAEVYRDVIATVKASTLQAVERSIDHINWRQLGELLESLP